MLIASVFRIEPPGGGACAGSRGVGSAPLDPEIGSPESVPTWQGLGIVEMYWLQEARHEPVG
jgi:hypothetical protein